MGVSAFIEVANSARGFNLNIHSPLEDILETLELIREGLITKGAFLLFGKNPQKRFPSAVLKCAFFSDKEMNQYLAQRIIGGTIFEQYKQALQFVGEYLPSVVDTSSGASTRMQWRFPLDVIRELLVNALVHRDYHAGVESYLSIVKDRGFEVYNPGILPAPRITPDTIYRDHPSVPANRRIARAFFLSGLIEQWGKGASRAWNLCRTHGAPEPVWTSKDGMGWVRLFG
jgi:ATP-dependent DNA helicase RecG